MSDISNIPFEDFFRKQHAIMLFMDGSTGQVLDANEAALRYYGYSIEQITRMQLADICQLDPEELAAERQRAAAGEYLYSKVSHRLASGEMRTVEVHTTPVSLAGKNCLLSIIQDITERERAQEALSESEDKLRHLFNNAEVGMFRTKFDGSEILDFNDKYLAIFGRSRQEMLGNPAVLHWAEPSGREEMIRRLEAEGSVTDFSCKMLDKQGNIRHCLTSVRAYKDRGILEGSIIDITELKRAEERVAEALAFNQRILDTSPVGILVYDAGGQCLSVNHAATEIIGGDADALLNQNFRSLGTWKRDNMLHFADAALQSGNTVQHEFHSTSSFGRTCWFQMRFVPFYTGRQKCLLLLLEDISGRRKVEEDRQRLESQA